MQGSALAHNQLAAGTNISCEDWEDSHTGQQTGGKSSGLLSVEDNLERT
jgi:hypothetical protein